MKASHLLIILMLFLLAPNTSLALISVGEISVDRAKELGIELRARPGGPNHAWIELEFKPEGKLARFQHVSIEVTHGDQLDLGWTPLKDVRTNRGTVLVRVMGSRTFLEKVTLRIIHGDFGDRGSDIRIKNFVDFEKLDQPTPTSKPKSVGTTGAATPAAATPAKAK